MGWYVRRAFTPFGKLFRINVSRAGLGLSVGVKGARIGIDGRGRAYTAAGRYGLYWKQYLDSRAARPGSITSGALDFFLIALALAGLAAVFAAMAP